MRPTKGDRVMYRDRQLQSHGHVGLVLERRGRVLRLKVVGQGRARRVDVDDVDGYWPKGARDRSPAALRPIEAGERK